MYLHPTDTVYTTLALGPKYRKHSETLIQSVLKFSYNDIYVFTDDPDHYGTWYDKRRVHLVKFDETLTDLPLVYKNGVFNYNLKMVPIHWVMHNIRAPLTIWADCDAFLFGQCESTMHRYFEQDGLYGRLRHRLCETDEHVLIQEKVDTMGVDVSQIETRVPVEHIMFLRIGEWYAHWLDAWKKYAMLSYDKGATPFYEAIEMTLALHEAKVPTFHLDNRHPFTEGWRSIHENTIHNPFVL